MKYLGVCGIALLTFLLAPNAKSSEFEDFPNRVECVAFDKNQDKAGLVRVVMQYMPLYTFKSPVAGFFWQYSSANFACNRSSLIALSDLSTLDGLICAGVSDGDLTGKPLRLVFAFNSVNQQLTAKFDLPAPDTADGPITSEPCHYIPGQPNIKTRK